MFSGAHFLLQSTDADADRAFLQEVLGLPSVDAGHGWLIFALPPAELAVHPSEPGDPRRQEGSSLFAGTLYLMCDDLVATLAKLNSKGVSVAPVTEERWGTATSFALPSGGAIGLYQPKHPTALNLSAR